MRRNIIATDSLIHRVFPVQKLFNEAKEQGNAYLVLMSKLKVTHKRSPLMISDTIALTPEFKTYPIRSAAELRNTGYGQVGNKILGIYDLSMNFEEANNAKLHIPVALKDTLCMQNLRMQEKIRAEKYRQKGILETWFGPKEKPLKPMIGIGTGNTEPSIFDR